MPADFGDNKTRVPIRGLDLRQVRADPRWSLIEDLDRAARGSAADWSAFRIQRRENYWDGGDGAPPVLGREVTITFDARMSVVELLGLIRAVWGYLRQEKKALRTSRNRALGDRKIALLHHVCIDAADVSWAERFDRWNRRWKRRQREWQYDTADAFITDCHDAEEQLVGSRRGLAWFYEPMARLSRADLKTLAKERDAEAIREELRRNDDFIRQAKRMVERGGATNG